MSQCFLKHCLLLWLCPEGHLRVIFSQRAELLLINCTATNKKTNKQKPVLKLKFLGALCANTSILWRAALRVISTLKKNMYFYNFLFLLLQQSLTSKRSEIAFHQERCCCNCKNEIYFIGGKPLGRSSAWVSNPKPACKVSPPPKSKRNNNKQTKKNPSPKLLGL